MIRKTTTSTSPVSSIGVGLSLPLWLAIALIAVGGAWAWWAYRSTTPQISNLRRRLLTSVRTIALALLLLTLFDTFIARSTIEEEVPRLIVALDRSASMARTDSGVSRFARGLALSEQVRRVVPPERITIVSFADSVDPLGQSGVAGLHPDGNLTDIDRLLRHASSLSELESIGGILVISDGIQTGTTDASAVARELPFPVFTLPPGKSPSLTDLRVTEVLTARNGIAAIAQPVTVRLEADVTASTPISITLSDGGGIVATERIQVRAGRGEYNTSFLYTPTSDGDVRLTVSIFPLPGEPDVENNRMSTIVRVDDRHRRLLLIAGSPSPDVGFIRRIVERMAGIDLDVAIAIGPRQPELTDARLANLDQIIFVDYPTSSADPATIERIARLIRYRSVPLLIVPGPHVDPDRLDRFGDLVPIRLNGSWDQTVEARVAPVPGGSTHSVTREVSESIKQIRWDELPPISLPTGNISTQPDARILLQSGPVGQPVLAIIDRRSVRTAMFGGYDLWRWELAGEGLSEAQGRSTFPLLESLISSSVRWLDAGERSRQVMIRSTRPSWRLNEPVEIRGEVFDDEFRPVGDSEVTYRIAGGGITRSGSLLPEGSGSYGILVKDLPAGTYALSGTARSGRRVLGNDNGSFIVEPISSEDTARGIDHEFLRALAESSGGYAAEPEGLEDLADSILTHSRMVPRSVETRAEVSMRNSAWFLFTALLFFSLEWYLRRRWGLL